MKKFILRILLFFGIVAAVDFAVGKLFWNLQSNVAKGRTGVEFYACMESKEDILIMGSSRATHHYIPQMITDSLGLSCFNAGQDGNGIIMQYGRWKMISERYAPKMIIYDINPSFDLVENDNMTYIDHLKPYCREKEVRDYVSTIFPLERLKLMSQMYRYNYKFLEIMSDCVRGDDGELKGYIPLYGQIRPEVVERSLKSHEIGIIKTDETKLKYLERLARDCRERNTKLVFVVSPFFGGGSLEEKSFSKVQEIASQYGASFAYYNTSELTSDIEIFKDSQHLNDDGAKEMTSLIIGLMVFLTE